MKKGVLRAVLFGPQGSGKGTQGVRLAEHFGVPLIGSGEMLRQEIAAETPIGNIVKSYIERGALVPDEMVRGIIQAKIQTRAPEEGFILDGYPRNVDQAESLDNVVDINLAIQIKITDDAAVERILYRRSCSKCKKVFMKGDAAVETNVCDTCGGELVQRNDDKEESVVRRRLEEYHFMTEPLAVYYRQRGVLLAVKGEQAVDTLYQELIRKMGRLGFKAK